MRYHTRLGLALFAAGMPVSAGRADEAAVRKAVTFYASFDEAVKGDVGGGDLNPGTRFPHPTEKGQFVFEKGFDATVLKIAKGKGVAGGAFEATDVLPKNGWLYFPVKGNLAFNKDGWSGSVSVWCNTDPNRLIKAKFCDPVQITQKGYDNGALWFDFNDAKPRALRFGAFTARPAGQKAVAETDPKAPLIRAPAVDWKAGEWHHVVLTFQNLDTGKPDAVTRLYLDGKWIGEVKDQAIAMGWDVEKAGVYLSLGYVGLLDEFALFDRALTAEDVAVLHKKPDLLASLKKPAKPIPPKPTSRTTKTLEGWTVRVDDRLLTSPDDAVGNRALRFLEGKLSDIKTVLPADKVKKLQAVTIVLDLTHGNLGPMQYHPSAGWLRANGYAADLAKCVHLPRAADVATKRNVAEQPWVILHELAHAYHDQVLGFDDPRVRDTFENYKLGGRGETVLLFNGKRVRHYALTDHKEFFAEMTESYFGVNDFFPFNRAELKEREPEVHDLMARVWESSPPKVNRAEIPGGF